MTLEMRADAAGTMSIGGDLKVNRMGFGGMRLCGPGIWDWPADRKNALDVLERAVALGVNFIDTADAYGPEVNERQIAQALHPYPDDLVIATKCGLVRPGPSEWKRNGEPERLRLCCDDSLARLRRDHLDLLQLHAVDENYPLADQVGVLKELRDAGKVRHVGLSNVTVEQLMEARDIVEIVSVQNPFNVLDHHGNDDMLAYCEREHIAFLPYFPLDAGDVGADERLKKVAAAHDATVYQVALAWLLERSKHILPIPGTSSIAHLEENVAAASLRLTHDEMRELSTVA